MFFLNLSEYSFLVEIASVFMKWLLGGNIISKKRIFASSNLYVCLRKSSECFITENEESI